LGGINILRASRPLQYSILQLYVIDVWGGGFSLTNHPHPIGAYDTYAFAHFEKIISKI